MFIADDWKEYEIIDAADGEKLERWGKYVLRRPDPQVIWPLKSQSEPWRKAHAHYHRGSSGRGGWSFYQQLPERWEVSYGDLSFYIKPMSFKHTGLFPEQAVNWNWIIERIRSRKGEVRVLNLFAYTGGATVAAAFGGAEVCHVDAAKGMVHWAKENIQLSGLGHRKVRFIVDDVLKFVEREIRRGRQYEAVIMDPPSFGRGPRREVWKMEEQLYNLVVTCMKVLAPHPLFFLINSYTTGLAPTLLYNILTLTMGRKYGGVITADEVGLPIGSSSLILPCGASGRWEANP